MNSITLGGKPVYDPDPAFRAPINMMEIGGGAGTYGIGCFLMLQTDFESVQKANPGKTVPLVMSSDDGSPGIKINAIIGGAEEVRTDVSTPAQNFMNVIVFDTRKLFYAALIHSFNVQVTQFSHTSGNADLQPQTTFDGHTTPWTWPQLVTDCELPALPNTPTWLPRNRIYNGVAQCRVMDDIAASLYLIVGFDPTQSDAAHGVSFASPGTMSAANTALQAKAKNFLTGGGPAEVNTAAPPKTLRVTFLVCDLDNDQNPYADQRTYTKDIVVNPLGTITQILNVGDYIGIYQGGQLVNQCELDVVAADLASRAYTSMITVTGTFEYAGMWPFTVDGAIRSVMWISNESGARTIIRLNDEKFWSPFQDIRARMELPNNTLAVGLGQISVGVGPNGTRYIWQSPAKVKFWAKITGSAPLHAYYPSGHFKYGWLEQARNEFGWITPSSPRSGDQTCNVGECDGPPEVPPGYACPPGGSSSSATPAKYCTWALNAFEAANTGGAAMSPVSNGTIVEISVQYDSTGIPRYSFEVPPSGRLGHIVCNGPCGESGFPDNRYWVQVLNIDASTVSDVLTTENAGTIPVNCGEACPPEKNYIVPATNLAENNAKTHNLSPGTLVWIDAQPDLGNTLRYVIVGADTTPTGMACGSQSSSSSSSSSSSATPGCGGLTWVLANVDLRCIDGVYSMVKDFVQVCSPISPATMSRIDPEPCCCDPTPSGSSTSSYSSSSSSSSSVSSGSGGLMPSSSSSSSISSSSSSSSSYSSSSSSSSHSMGPDTCFYWWSCTFDCSLDKWGGPFAEPSSCNAPGDPPTFPPGNPNAGQVVPLGQWAYWTSFLDTNGNVIACKYVYVQTNGGHCTVDGDCTNPPPAPTNCPTASPECACTPSGSSNSGSSRSSSASVAGMQCYTRFTYFYYPCPFFETGPVTRWGAENVCLDPATANHAWVAAGNGTDVSGNWCSWTIDVPINISCTNDHQCSSFELADQPPAPSTEGCVVDCTRSSSNSASSVSSQSSTSSASQAASKCYTRWSYFYYPCPPLEPGPVARWGSQNICLTDSNVFNVWTATGTGSDVSGAYCEYTIDIPLGVTCTSTEQCSSFPLSDQPSAPDASTCTNGCSSAISSSLSSSHANGSSNSHSSS